MSRRGFRQLIVGDDTYRWSRRHVHERADATPSYLGCREVVTIHRDGFRGRLDVVFRSGTDHLVADGSLHTGAIWRADRLLNLNRPGVVRALLDEALARGWRPDDGPVQVDGWTLFDSVVQRCAPADGGGRGE